MPAPLRQERNSGRVREVGQSIVVLALTGSSVGGFLAMLHLATKVLGR